MDRKTGKASVFSFAVCLWLAAAGLAGLPSGVLAQGGAVDFTSSNLPIVLIDTQGQEIPLDDPRIIAEMSVIDNGPGRRNAVTDSVNGFHGRISIEIRGSSSTTWRKKQYGFETQDSLGQNLNVSLLGLPKENDWILNAPYIDKSLMRNVLAYKLASDTGHYASRTRYCELILNGQYQGIYILMEKIKRDKNRVNVAKLDPQEITGDDLTGGYIIKIDRPDSRFFVSHYPPYPGAEQKILYLFVYPDEAKIAPEQETYIKNYIFNFEDLMASDHYAEPASHYSQVIDIDSFIDYFLVCELAKNVDAYRLSTFMYKDKDSKGGKLAMGPVWDFNLAFGNANYYDGEDTNGWMLYHLTHTPAIRQDFALVPFYWNRLLQDTLFTSRTLRRWQALRRDALASDRIFSYIDALADTLDEAKTRNFQIWSAPGQGGEGFWPVPGIFYTFSTYQDEIDYLKSWVQNRLAWMDANIASLPERFKAVQLRLPKTFFLRQNYPNPFNAGTTVEYGIPRLGRVSIAVYNAAGQTVRVLYDDFETAGEYTVHWDAMDEHGRKVPSGLYVISANYAGNRQSVKVLHIK